MTLLWSRSSLNFSLSNDFRMANRLEPLRNSSTRFHLAHHIINTSQLNPHIWIPLPLLHRLSSPKTLNHHKAAPFQAQTPARLTVQSATARIPLPLLSRLRHLLPSNRCDKASGIYKIFSSEVCMPLGTLFVMHKSNFYLLHSLGVVPTISACASPDCSIYGRIHTAYGNAYIFLRSLCCCPCGQFPESVSLCVELRIFVFMIPKFLDFLQRRYKVLLLLRYSCLDMGMGIGDVQRSDGEIWRVVGTFFNGRLYGAWKRNDEAWFLLARPWASLC